MDTGRIDAYAAEVLATGVTPSLALAVTDAERTLLTRSYGEPVADGCLWQIGSISKSMTAAAVLQLVEEGALDLHAPVTEYVPWFTVRSAFAPITLHHLLTHTAGLIIGAEISTASTYDVIALADTDAGFAPGAHYWYSNVGYRLVGLALEAVAGRAYPELVQERLLDRLGMRDSTPVIVHDTRRRLPQGHTAFYDDRPFRADDGLVPATWIESAEADGSLCCAAEDLATWLRALWNGDSRLLSPESLAVMKSPLVIDDQESGAYGYGLAVDERGFGHGGGMVGYQSEMRADDASGLGAVAFANGIGGAEELCLGALAIARGEEPEPPAAEPAEPLLDDGSGPPEWRPLIGHYRSHNAWCTNFRVAARAGRLVFGFDCYDSERHPLERLPGGSFRVGEQEWSPERLAFDTVVDGRAQRASFSGAHFYRTFTP